jgi:dTDP-6-deoxy-L-talose 4-dehydrogenase (NAD+)
MLIAVTGASGFLGSHVLNHLATLPVNVVAISRHTAGRTETARLCWTEIDIARPPKNFYDALGRPDVLLHLAWDGLPNYGAAHHLAEQLPAQARFLEAAIDSGLGAVVAAGTCLEYGMQAGRLLEARPCSPTVPYAEAKYALLQRLQVVKAQHPFALTWARLFYMYGDGQQEKSLWSQFMAAHRRGAIEFDMSGGNQLRDFLPVSKVAEYLSALALAAGDFGVLNVCSGEPKSVRSLVESWAKNLRWNVQLNLGCYPYPDFEPMIFWGDNTKLKEILAAK